MRFKRVKNLQQIRKLEMLIIKIGIKLGMMKTMYLIRIEMKAKLQVDEYTRLEEEKTLIENGTVFFVNQLNFWGETTLGLDC